MRKSGVIKMVDCQFFGNVSRSADDWGGKGGGLGDGEGEWDFAVAGRQGVA